MNAKLLSSLNLNTQEFSFQFQSHPDYPSALAFSDTLNFLGVKNSAYNLEKKFWEELPDEFITVYKDEFSLIQKNKDNFKIISNDVKTISKEELYKNSTNFILLFEKEKQEKTEKSLNFKWFVFVFFAVILCYSAVFLSWEFLLFNALSLAGVYISLEIFSEKFGGNSVVLDNLCNSGAKNVSQTGCNKIINSDKISIFGLKLSDFSLWFFFSTLVLGIFLPQTSGILKWISFASILVIFYSIFVQVFVEKTFCKICFLIIWILISQIVLSYFFFDFQVSKSGIFLSLIMFSVVFVSLVFINNILTEKEKFRKENIKNLRFKRNYEIFKKELISQEKIQFQNTEIFKLGKPDSKLHISLVSNPFCGFCKDAHKILEKLLEKYPGDISAQIRFNYLAENTDENYEKLISNFLQVFENQSQKQFLETVQFWFETRNEQKFERKFNPNFEETDLSKIIKTAEENRNFGFTFTPIFLINGWKFPEKYEREDIFYFIDELLEDQDFENKE
jgi:uncharacterized membrane protein